MCLTGSKWSLANAYPKISDLDIFSSKANHFSSHQTLWNLMHWSRLLLLLSYRYPKLYSIRYRINLFSWENNVLFSRDIELIMSLHRENNISLSRDNYINKSRSRESEVKYTDGSLKLPYSFQGLLVQNNCVGLCHLSRSRSDIRISGVKWTWECVPHRQLHVVFNGFSQLATLRG